MINKNKTNTKCFICKDFKVRGDSLLFLTQTSTLSILQYVFVLTGHYWAKLISYWLWLHHINQRLIIFPDTPLPQPVPTEGIIGGIIAVIIVLALIGTGIAFYRKFVNKRWESKVGECFSPHHVCPILLMKSMQYTSTHCDPRLCFSGPPKYKPPPPNRTDHSATRVSHKYIITVHHVRLHTVLYNYIKKHSLQTNICALNSWTKSMCQGPKNRFGRTSTTLPRVLTQSRWGLIYDITAKVTHNPVIWNEEVWTRGRVVHPCDDPSTRITARNTQTGARFVFVPHIWLN